jgi:hypothetical protein
VVSFTRRPLYPQEQSPWYPLDRRLGGPQSRSGRGGEKKNSQPLPGLEPPIIQPVAQRCTAELSRTAGEVKKMERKFRMFSTHNQCSVGHNFIGLCDIIFYNKCPCYAKTSLQCKNPEVLFTAIKNRFYCN